MSRAPVSLVRVFGLFAISCLLAEVSLAAWPPAGGLPMTRWAKDVSPERPVLPEYPRPQLVREQWLNLNGMWDYAITAKDASKPARFDGKILVPFAPQSFLSQVNKPVSETSQIWYRRTVEIPAGWAGQHVLLNFGAVNWESHVFVNGKEVGSHTGGYDGFTCDITDALKSAGPQELIVTAWNPIEGGQPRGKQALKPDGIFYTPTTGVWQTVWIEPVPKSHIDNLRIVPDVDRNQLHLTVNASEPTKQQTVEAFASADGKEVGRASGKPGEALTISIPNAKLWWPASPFLYDLKVTLIGENGGTTTLDSVASYFGMRKISVGPDDKGLARIMLNNKPVFQNGFLDQGFWPEGVYTAPTDEALKYDLTKLREFNYNLDRKHVKVEPERWYYWADKLGVLVWQDMPAAVELSYPPNSRSIPHREDNFESELRRMVRGRFNHPSIVMWILFNEGWGLPLKDRKSDRDKVEAAPEAKVRELRMVKAVREEDPTRLINAESGAGGGGNDHGEDLWDFGYGDVIDYHCYGHDGPKAEKKRAGIVGEYGWGLAPIAALRARLESSKHDDISGCVVTQLTDVENEHNGALDYARNLVRNVELDKEFPAGIIKVIHDFGYTDYPGGEHLAAQAAPRIFWASEPVRPNETVMVQGSDLGTMDTTVEMARLDDEPNSNSWTRVSLLQASDQNLKFVVPATWKPGVFACRITSNGLRSKPFLLNTPVAWWLQGDEGEAATPGGWLRVLGKSLVREPAAEEPANKSANSSTRRCTVRLEPSDGPPTELQSSSADCFSAKFELPGKLAIGLYTVRIHNGAGGALSWWPAGTLHVVPGAATPSTVFSVLDVYGPDAVKQMRNTLVKYIQPLDRTEGIQAALKKAKEHGGGVVYFPAGRYAVKGQLEIPDHTILRGEGMGVVTLWWGTGSFNLDGGGPQGRARVDGPKPPDILIFGRDYGLEEMSLYLPQKIQQGIVADNRLRMRKIRVRVDHSWLVEGRGEGTVLRMGRNFQVTDCDIFATGAAMRLGQYGIVANNRILAMKINTELGGSQNVIVEDNQFVSMDPTTYQNIAGRGRNIYYAHNRHESLYVHQADYSFTFDASTGAYMGGIAKAEGTQLTLAADPTYPQWATEKSDWWRSACVCILAGRGAGQWRDVVSNKGRAWEIDRPFDVAPDATSIATIVPFSGRVLVIGNRFEDAAWVNAGYGTSIEVIYAENTLVRTGILMNHGVHADDWFEPSWYVQYFDNRVTEGQTNIESLSGGQRSPIYSGPLTRCSVHRRQILTADNSGNIIIHGNIDDALVEGCQLNNPLSAIKVDNEAHGVVFRNNAFVGRPAPGYEGDGLKNAVVVPPLTDK